jgi:hypothetical protein
MSSFVALFELIFLFALAPQGESFLFLFLWAVSQTSLDCVGHALQPPGKAHGFGMQRRL